MANRVGNIIISWYERHQRDLPFRRTRDPYLIWLSEIILQQTRVEQGLPYYEKFIRKYPDVHQLAAASEEEVLKMWQGLGYYSRARNLHHTAQKISRNHGGVFPATYDALIRLKGIGDYTASAIASMAYGKPRAVVDGNVQRVLARIYAIDVPVNTTRGKQVVKQKAEELLDRGNPGDFNHAIMDFGAMQCKPAAPDCPACPLRKSCRAYRENAVDLLPVKNRKTARRQRNFHYAAIFHDNGLLLRKRTGDDIWKNMYDLPAVETKQPRILGPGDLKRSFGNAHEITFLKSYKHILTHQTIHAHFYEGKLWPDVENSSNGFTFVPFEKLQDYPLPRLIEKFFKESCIL